MHGGARGLRGMTTGQGYAWGREAGWGVLKVVTRAVAGGWNGWGSSSGGYNTVGGEGGQARWDEPMGGGGGCWLAPKADATALPLQYDWVPTSGCLVSQPPRLLTVPEGGGVAPPPPSILTPRCAIFLPRTQCGDWLVAGAQISPSSINSRSMPPCAIPGSPRI